jgi:5-methylthioribose kinase
MPTLDIEKAGALLQYLRETGRIEACETPGISRLRGGVSNRTMLVERAGGERWVIKQALDRLRVEVDWFSNPERIHREAEGLRWLERLLPEGSIAPFVFEDHRHHLLAMKAVPRPHENLKTLLLAGHVDAGHVRRFGELLGTLHRSGWERRENLAGAFADRSYFESLRLEPYYLYTAQQLRSAASFIAALVEETRARTLTLVHGDYSPKNILVHEETLVLLDHEVIHFGDPAFDVGFGLTHLLSKAHHLPEHRHRLAEAACSYWNAYLTAAGPLPCLAGSEPRIVEHTLACLLARVAGRSPLEYLNDFERQRQRDVVLALLTAPPRSVPVLVEAFLERL